MVEPNRKLTSWLIIFAVFAVHLALASGVPLGVDEAHYALYALHPALSYFDHPPMVGWLQMLIAPLGYNEFTIRLIPALMYAISSLLVMRLSERLFADHSGRVGLVAVFLLNTAPILQLMGWGLVPDLPLMVFGLLSIDAIWRIHQRNQLPDWLMLGVIYGLAGLSKYTAVFLPLGLVCFMFQHHGLRWLRQPGPWLAAIPAFLLITPVLIWNMQNDWASFGYQLDRGMGVNSWSPTTALGMQIVQMLLYTILAYVAAIVVTVQVLRARFNPKHKTAAWLIIWNAWPALLVIAWSAGDGAVLPNWPALMWTLLAPLSAYWVCQSWDKLWVKILIGVSSLLSIGVLVFLFGFLAFMPLSTFPFMKSAIKDLVGWKEAAVHARQLQEELRQEGVENPVLLVDNWVRASRIAWYAYPEPVQVISDRPSQFDFWYGEPDPQSRGILIRDKRRPPEDGRYQKAGIVCQLKDVLDTGVDGVKVNTFQFYYCAPEPGQPWSRYP